MADIGSVTFGGLATGLDTKTLINQLVGLSRQPIQRLEQSRSQEEKKISTFKDFSSKLLTFKSAADKLLNLTNFFARTNSVSDNTAMSVSVTSTAQVGNYTVTIGQLARIGQQTFVGVESKTSHTLSGTFMIGNAASNPSNFAISINTDGMSLEQLRDTINSDINNSGKVTATIIDTGIGVEHYRLQIKGNATGTTNDFSITSSSSLIRDNDVNMTFQAHDANFSIDGVSLKRSENIITDVIDGVTFTLKKNVLDPVIFTVDNDIGYIQSNIKTFISSYNEMRSYINSKSELDQKNPKNNGPFLGDSTVRGIYMRLQQLMTGEISGITENFSALHDIGITTGSDGKLNIDDTKLSNTLEKNSEYVSKMFIGTNIISGIASRVNFELNKFTNPIGGLINLRVNGIQSRITNLNDRINVVERRVSNYEKTLVRQFTTLEQLISSLQTKGNAFNSIRA